MRRYGSVGVDGDTQDANGAGRLFSEPRRVTSDLSRVSATEGAV